MPFVHSLVRWPTSDKRGWCAPVELGESAPHYMNFAVPLDAKGTFFGNYRCEVVVGRNGDRRIVECDLSARGRDSFKLDIGGKIFRFAVKPVLKIDGSLPYIGQLKHFDFRYAFAEIEPRDPDKLDDLCETEQTFVMGCDPYTHYRGIGKFRVHPAVTASSASASKA